MKSTAEEQSTERGSVSEQLNVGLSLVLVLERDALLNLGKFSLHPSIIFISMSVQLSQSLKAFLGAVVVDEPTGRLNRVSLCVEKY